MLPVSDRYEAPRLGPPSLPLPLGPTPSTPRKRALHSEADSPSVAASSLSPSRERKRPRPAGTPSRSWQLADPLSLPSSPLSPSPPPPSPPPPSPPPPLQQRQQAQAAGRQLAAPSPRRRGSWSSESEDSLDEDAFFDARDGTRGGRTPPRAAAAGPVDLASSLPAWLRSAHYADVRRADRFLVPGRVRFPGPTGRSLYPAIPFWLPEPCVSAVVARIQARAAGAGCVPADGPGTPRTAASAPAAECRTPPSAVPDIRSPGFSAPLHPGDQLVMTEDEVAAWTDRRSRRRGLPRGPGLRGSEPMATAPAEGYPWTPSSRASGARRPTLSRAPSMDALSSAGEGQLLVAVDRSISQWLDREPEPPVVASPGRRQGPDTLGQGPTRTPIRPGDARPVGASGQESPIFRDLPPEEVFPGSRALLLQGTPPPWCRPSKSANDSGPEAPSPWGGTTTPGPVPTIGGGASLALCPAEATPAMAASPPPDEEYFERRMQGLRPSWWQPAPGKLSAGGGPSSLLFPAAEEDPAEGPASARAALFPGHVSTVAPAPAPAPAAAGDVVTPLPGERSRATGAATSRWTGGGEVAEPAAPGSRTAPRRRGATPWSRPSWECSPSLN
ncbi:hypothetical protein H696_02642 [Fonticula alba]|uniref:Uncharacterized protein n=1 Tax=Fonticula alba TaxID=691883 RepID=A0A058Z8Q8_FONAL|nr:hypothetical protein H696_02642 [Fonticula alba]KCV70313.1 hypothetical protein H696_02642 [Fonticula alba]|eukprot:XP_009494829.1 hypothetical protein H696_02642 [Fonticula alba]